MKLRVKSRLGKKGNKQYYIRLSSDIQSRDYFFNFLKKAKLYNEAIKQTPQKFDKNLNYKQYMHNLNKIHS